MLCNGLAAIGLAIGLSHAAQAVVIDFESLDTTNVFFPPLFVQGDEFYQSGFFVDPFSNAPNAQENDLVGALVDGSDIANTCFSVNCPVNNSSLFYTGLNDGAMFLGRLDGGLFGVNGLDASFVGASGLALPATAGALRLQGVLPNGTSLLQTFFLTGPNAQGALNFASFTTSGAFSTALFQSMFIFGFTCDVSGSCAAFTTDMGQFALDNLNLSVGSVSAVPEPASLALMVAGLVAMGALRRRRPA